VSTWRRSGCSCFMVFGTLAGMFIRVLGAWILPVPRLGIRAGLVAREVNSMFRFIVINILKATMCSTLSRLTELTCPAFEIILSPS
jgi:hypothetical protein